MLLMHKGSALHRLWWDGVMLLVKEYSQEVDLDRLSISLLLNRF